MSIQVVESSNLLRVRRIVELDKVPKYFTVKLWHGVK